MLTQLTVCIHTTSLVAYIRSQLHDSTSQKLVVPVPTLPLVPLHGIIFKRLQYKLQT